MAKLNFIFIILTIFTKIIGFHVIILVTNNAFIFRTFSTMIWTRWAIITTTKCSYFYCIIPRACKNFRPIIWNSLWIYNIIMTSKCINQFTIYYLSYICFIIKRTWNNFSSIRWNGNFCHNTWMISKCIY